MSITISDEYKPLSLCKDFFKKIVGKQLTNAYRISTISLKEFLNVYKEGEEKIFSKTDGPFLIEFSDLTIVGFNRDESTGELICWLERDEQLIKNEYGETLVAGDEEIINVRDHVIDKDFADLVGATITDVNFYTSEAYADMDNILLPVEVISFLFNNKNLIV